MNILIYSDKFLPTIGGSCRVAYELAKRFNSLGHLVSVLTIDSGTPERSAFDGQVPFRIFRTPTYQPHLFRRFLTYRYFRNVLIRRKVQCIYILASHYDYLLISVARRLGIPYVVSIQTPQELILPVTPRRYIDKFRKRYASAPVFIAITRTIKKNLVKIGVPESKIKMVYIGVNHDRFRPGVDFSHINEKYALKGKRIILTVTQLVQSKGIGDVLLALKEVTRRIHNVVYLIVGAGGYEKELKAQVLKLNLEGSVIFTGTVPHGELPAYYCAADLFVMPSYSEGMALSYLEAQACGLPVVGCRGISEDAVSDGVTGRLVHPGSINELSAVILELLSDENLREKMGAAGREMILKKFNWDSIAKANTDIMLDLCGVEQKRPAPLVSIIIPTHNRGHLITESIESVLSQTYRNFELLIVDDGSTDGTKESVSAINDPRLKYVRVEERKGPASSRNTGLRLARGKYIAFQDDDDYWRKDKLQKQVVALEKNPASFGLAYSGVWRSKNGRKKYSPAGRNVKYTGNLYKRLLRGNFITIHVLVKRECFEKLGYFDENLPALEDWDMWLRMSGEYDFFYIDDPLTVCRETANSVNSNWRNTVNATKMIVKKYSGVLRRHKKTLSHHSFRIGKILVKNGEVEEGIKNIFDAIGVYPLNLYYWRTLVQASIIKGMELIKESNKGR
ncbi:MAG: glycosyltransferase [Elusimicrobiota bacterium]